MTVFVVDVKQILRDERDEKCHLCENWLKDHPITCTVNQSFPSVNTFD